MADYTAGYKRRAFNQNTPAKNRKSTDTSANSGKTANKSKTLYYRSKDDAKPVYKKQTKALHSSKGRPVRQAYRYKKKTSQGNTVLEDADVYVRPPDWTWKDEVETYLKKGARGPRYQSGMRILEENPLARMKSYKGKPVRQRKPAKAAYYSKRMENGNPAFNTTEWINGRVRDYPEDRGTALKQAKRLASLYVAVDPVTKGFSDEFARELHKDIQDAPVNLQELYIRYGNRLKPVVDSDEAARFDLLDRRVHGNLQEMESGDIAHLPGTNVWHEYGHNLDNLTGWRQLSPRGYSPYYRSNRQRLQDSIKNEMDRTVRDYWRAKYDDRPYNEKEAVRELFGTLFHDYSAADRAPLSDMMGPYSTSIGRDSFPLGSGHPAWYNAIPGNPSVEAFAEMTAAAIQGGEQLKLIQSVLPESYGMYLNMLSDMASPYTGKNTPYSKYWR